MLNAASGKNAFRGFASKLREQAKDVVGNVKLPSFDDMAKNDEYIHSPDFNVKSKRRSRQEDHAVNSATDEASKCSTESSWSLLDRPTSTANSLVTGTATTTTTTTAVTTPVTSNQQTPSYSRSQSEASRSIEEGNEEVSTHSDRHSTNKSSVMLSVVSDALQSPLQTPKRKIRYPIDDDSDQSSQDFDEEDPILSMLRKDDNINDTNQQQTTKQTSQAPASVITIQKSSNRFLDDVRLQSPVDQSLDEIIKTDQTKDTESKRSFGFFKNNTIQNFRRMVLRKGPEPQQQQQTKRPPLARERTPKIQKEPEFEIKAASSAGMLGDDDLEQLNQLKLAGQSSSACSSVSNFVEYLREHRHSMFVAFTLLLSLYVYFRKL